MKNTNRKYKKEVVIKDFNSVSAAMEYMNHLVTEEVVFEVKMTIDLYVTVKATVGKEEKPKQEKKTEKKVESKKESTKVEVRENKEKQGVELIFNEKPAKEVLGKLKEMGFRWHNANKLWYAKATQERVEFAKSL